MMDVKPRINLNTATSEELEPLNGVGPALAGAIVAYRDEFGPFADVEDLTAIKGIGPVLVDKIRDSVTLNNSEQRPTRATSIVVAPDLLAETAGEPAEAEPEPISMDLEQALAAELATADDSTSGEPAWKSATDETPETGWHQEPEAAAEKMETGAEIDPEAAAEDASEATWDGEPVPAIIEETEPTVKPEPVAAAAEPAPTRAEKIRPSAEQDYRLPPPLEIVEPRSGRLTFWKALLLVLLGALLGGALSIGAVWMLNGSLSFASRDQVYNLQADVAQARADRASLERQIATLDEQLGQMRSDLNALPQLRADIAQVSERAGALRDEIAGVQGDLGMLRGDLVALGEQVGGLDEQIGVVDGRVNELGTRFDGMVSRVDELQGEMDAVAQQAERFDVFLSGLRALLQETAPAE
jgi:competence ComEA-like helix-hairpin-helix protein